MSELIKGVNPQILKWAREKSGLSLEDVAKSFKKTSQMIESWEKGEQALTYVQLEKLAQTLYKRPVALFFFPEPPEEMDNQKEFRTLPKTEFEKLSSDTLYAVREAKAMQLSLQEINDSVNPASKKIFKDFKISLSSELKPLIAKMRNYLGISFAEQTKWETEDFALKQWRNAVEDKGIFVFKRSFKQKKISGFCLIDDEFPIIYLNNSTSKTRQIFSIFHELAHVLLNVSNITETSSNYSEMLEEEAKKIEIFCNKFSSEFLIPSDIFNEELKGKRNIDDEFIKELAKKYKVSREVILRKCFDKNLINEDFYNSKSKQFLEEYEKSKTHKKGGGNYYLTQITYLGKNYLKLVFGKYYQGKITQEQLPDYLNVKAKNIDSLEQQLFEGLSQ